jgi:hypothetical protein
MGGKLCQRSAETCLTEESASLGGAAILYYLERQILDAPLAEVLEETRVLYKVVC